VPTPVLKLSDHERRALERWWVDRLGIEECRELATLIWGP